MASKCHKPEEIVVKLRRLTFYRARECLGSMPSQDLCSPRYFI